jgi:hypothetical protein
MQTATQLAYNKLESMLEQAREMARKSPLDLTLRLAVRKAERLLAVPKDEDEPIKTMIVKVKEIKASLPVKPRVCRKPKPTKLWGQACREHANRPAWNPSMPKSLPDLLKRPEWEGSVYVGTQEHVTAPWEPLGWESSYMLGGERAYVWHDAPAANRLPVHGCWCDSRTMVDVYRHPCGAELRIRVDAIWNK